MNKNTNTENSSDFNIVSKEEALKEFLSGEVVYFGTEVKKAWFSTEGLGEGYQSERGFDVILKNIDEKNGLDTTLPLEFAIKKDC